VKVHVHQDDSGDYRWTLKATNGEILSDSAEGYVDRDYCVQRAALLNPEAELVIDE
jgi:uncharacterized protein